MGVANDCPWAVTPLKHVHLALTHISHLFSAKHAHLSLTHILHLLSPNTYTCHLLTSHIYFHQTRTLVTYSHLTVTFTKHVHLSLTHISHLPSPKHVRYFLIYFLNCHLLTSYTDFHQTRTLITYSHLTSHIYFHQTCTPITYSHLTFTFSKHMRLSLTFAFTKHVHLSLTHSSHLLWPKTLPQGSAFAFIKLISLMMTYCHKDSVLRESNRRRKLAWKRKYEEIFVCRLRLFAISISIQRK